ncbi:MAG: DUF1826 domain-containing protein [Proteobacteria bacterium]|nr:DUF1826 domain-containing protein [Pseudomonadota bacterium]
MTAASRQTHLIHHPARRAVQGPDPEVLAGIYEPEVNLAVWRRGAKPAVSAQCISLLQQRYPLALRTTVAVAALRNEPEVTLPAAIAQGPLAADIALLVEMFACLFELEQVGLRLMVLDHAMCPRFHVDRVHCRLLATYGGEGTQWLRDSQLSQPWRDLLAAAGQGSAAAQAELDAGTESIGCLDVALLKGEIWPDNAGHGLVHRSPQPGPGGKRLLLTLDIV